jgi:type II secretory pathway component PulM
LKDIDWREKIILVPLVLLIFWIGIYPKPLLERIEPAAKQVLQQVSRATTVEMDDNFHIRKKTVNLAADTTVTVSYSEGEVQ